MSYEDVFHMVGNTPHLRVKQDGLAGAEVYIKLESYNPTGSVKDRACVRMIRDKLERGELRPGMVLLDASSGNMACAIAYFGRVLGYPAHVFSSSKLTDDKRAFLCYFGATLDLVGTFTIEGNRKCREIAEQEPERYCFLDQLHNWCNPLAHEEATGPEILAQFPDVAMVVGSLGSGGSLFGTGKVLKARNPAVRVVAVEAASGTRLPGTGAFLDGDYISPFIQRGYDEGIFDLRVTVTYDDAVRSTLFLRDQGIFGGLQTGCVYHAAILSAREQGVTGPIVCISGDSGWKNMSKLVAL